MFLAQALARYERAQVQPGEAVGAVGAHSLGEPATQMTLKTFHFAGVASMNVTLGVPRIKEIMNATKVISTPIIEAPLVNSESESAARIVKGRIEKTELGDIAKSVTEQHVGGQSSLVIRLDLATISSLMLEISAQDVAEAIVASKIKPKITANDISVQGSAIVVTPPERDGPSRRRLGAISTASGLLPHSERMEAWLGGNQYYALQDLKQELPKVIVRGISSVNRAVISRDDKDETKFKLLVEGISLLQVMGTPGVDGLRTISNHIIEVKNTLGIEAARGQIMKELNRTYGSYGIGIDPRHLMLLADVMTYRAEVLGITRFGIARMKESVLMLASFEKTPDHLFDAALHSKVDRIAGVSECIVTGRPCNLGTGAFRIQMMPSELPTAKQQRKARAQRKRDRSQMEGPLGAQPWRTPAPPADVQITRVLPAPRPLLLQPTRDSAPLASVRAQRERLRSVSTDLSGRGSLRGVSAGSVEAVPLPLSRRDSVASTGFGDLPTGLGGSPRLGAASDAAASGAGISAGPGAGEGGAAGGSSEAEGGRSLRPGRPRRSRSASLADFPPVSEAATREAAGAPGRDKALLSAFPSVAEEEDR